MMLSNVYVQFEMFENYENKWAGLLQVSYVVTNKQVLRFSLRTYCVGVEHIVHASHEQFFCTKENTRLVLSKFNVCNLESLTTWPKGKEMSENASV